jgi:membrane protein involved in colicin uptake
VNNLYFRLEETSIDALLQVRSWLNSEKATCEDCIIDEDLVRAVRISRREYEKAQVNARLEDERRQREQQKIEELQKRLNEERRLQQINAPILNSKEVLEEEQEKLRKKEEEAHRLLQEYEKSILSIRSDRENLEKRKNEHERIVHKAEKKALKRTLQAASSTHCSNIDIDAYKIPRIQK